MHPLMLKEIVARCRQRIGEGDCPTVPPFPVEQLEEAIAELARPQAQPMDAEGKPNVATVDRLIEALDNPNLFDDAREAAAVLRKVRAILLVMDDDSELEADVAYLRAKNDPRLFDIANQLIYCWSQDGLLSEAQRELDLLRNELAETKRPLDEQMRRLNERVIALNDENLALKRAATRAQPMDDGERDAEPPKPAAWLHPDWLAGNYHLSVSPVTTYERRDWIPLYAEQRIAPAVPKWIPVSERLPEIVKEADGGVNCVLVYWLPDSRESYLPNPDVSNTKFLHVGGRGRFTHWMPLPAAPSQAPAASEKP